MNKAQKFLVKLNDREKIRVFEALEAIKLGDISKYDVKKLKGNIGVFRIRIGKVRIKYFVNKTGEMEILFAGLRSDTTYNN